MTRRDPRRRKLIEARGGPWQPLASHWQAWGRQAATVANAVRGLRTAAAPLGEELPRSKRMWGIPARLARQGGEGAGRGRSAKECWDGLVADASYK